MMKRCLTVLSLAALSSIVALPAHASLIGSSVSGSLTFGGDPSNYFDPGNGFVPASGYLNAAGTTVVVSGGSVEFGFDDGANQIAADFSGNQITVSDAVELSGLTNSFELQFTDAAFAGLVTTGLSGSGMPSDFSLVGTTLTFDYPGRSVTAGETLTTQAELTATPEPSSLALMMTPVLASVAVFGMRGFRGGV